MAPYITTRYHCAECHYAECYIVFVVMLSFFFLSVFMLSVVMLSVVAPLTFHVKCFLAPAKKVIKQFGVKTLDKLECFTRKYIYILIQCMLARCTPK